MKSNSYRVILVSLLMIFSSLAGCLEGEEDTTDDIDSLGTVMVSTYHVGELVKAVAGDHVTLDYMSQDNIPAHDYEPSASDLIRLQSADLFFYHGLGLEPWVDSTLESLGDNAPTSIETHRMPSGETSLDYEGMLVSELCELLSEGPYESTTLSMDDGETPEIHAEYTAHTLSFPEMEDDHDDHGDEDDHDDHDDHGDEDDHDDHDDHGDEDDHDDHDDHGDHDEHDHAEHGHGTPEETIENPADCPADTMISIFHLEEGEYVLEFEEEDFHDFNMAVLKMGGGHAHHDHGDHDDHGDEDDHDDEEDHDGHGDDHDEHDEEMTPEHALEEFDSNNDSHISWDEIWAGWMTDDHDDHDDHNETDDGHDDHDPIEEAMEEYMMDMLMSMFNESDADNDTLLSMAELENFIESMEHLEDDLDSAVTEIMISAFDGDEDGLLSMSEFVSMMGDMDDDHDDHNETDDDHDDHNETDDDHDDEFNETEMMEVMFGMFDTNNDGFVNASELDMLMEMGEDEHDEHAGYVTIHVEAEGEYGFLLPSDVTLHVLSSRDAHEGHGHDDHGDEEHGDDDRGDDDHGDEDHSDDDRGDDDHGDEEHGDDDRDRDDHDDHDNHSLEEIPYDPHSWLDPLAFKAQIDVVLDALIIAFPSGAEEFTVNADAYKVKLDTLVNGFEDAFGEDGTCVADKSIAANHNAYSYLTQRYEIEFVTIHGVDPEGEPTAENVADVVQKISEDEITVFFVEEFTDPSSVEAIQSQSGVSILYLYTMEMPPKDGGEDYISLMQKNLGNLMIGLGC